MIKFKFRSAIYNRQASELAVSIMLLLVICSFVIVAAVTIPRNYRPAPNAIQKGV
jgi:hypothetical protein